MDLAACLEPLRADVVALGGREVAVAEEGRGEAGLVRGAVGEAGGGAGAEAVGLIFTPSRRSVTRWMRP